jgi:methyl-accepting chemotaxis protein
MSFKKQIYTLLALLMTVMLILLAESHYLLGKIDDVINARDANDEPYSAAVAFKYHVVQMQQFATDASAVGDPESLKEEADNFESANIQLDKIVKAMPGEAERVAVVRKNLKSFHETGIRMANAYISNGREAGNLIMKEDGSGFDAQSETLQKSFVDLFNNLAEININLKEDLVKTEKQGRLFLTASVALSMVLIAALLLAFSSRVLDMLGGEPAYAVEVTRRIAGGDLATPISGSPKDGSLLDAMGKMQAALNSIVRQVVQDAEKVAIASESLVTVSSDVARAAENQSESATSLAAVVEEMTTSIAQVSDNATEVNDAAQRSGKLSSASESDVQRTIQDMNDIADAVRSSSDMIQHLDEHSRQIEAIVNVIREIADQTNLLALNAAIEAARAGEQGRGFAVVADEVRKLAERTSSSTQEIGEMIHKIESSTQGAVDSMDKGVGMVGRGVEASTAAGESMRAVSSEVSHVAQSVSGISDALREQSSAVHEIAQNIERIAQMSESSSQAANQGAESAQQLRRLAISLQSCISSFRV